MKRWLMLVLCLGSGVTLLAQQTLIESSFVINVEVPVRVFKDGKFVEDLTLDDFEVLESGVPQKLEAVYLIKKQGIARKEEKRPFHPETSRTFYLFFEVGEYSPRLHQAIEFFMDRVFLPADDLILISPRKTYRLKEIAKEKQTKQEIVKEIKALLRPDAVMGNSDLRTTLRDITSIARELRSFLQRIESGEGPLDQGETTYMQQKMLVEYTGLTTRLRTLRQADELRLLDLARYLSLQDRQNFVFIFYEKKLIPQIDPLLWNRLLDSMEEDQYVRSLINEAIRFNHQEEYLDHLKISQAFADTSSSVHFLHVSPLHQRDPDVRMQEAGAETFKALASSAHATGGYAASSSNPESLFRSALETAENYYLLYYTPKNYTGDGGFKYLRVNVKRKDCKVTHRMGYFAD